MQSLQMAANGYDPTVSEVPTAEVVSANSSASATSNSGTACALHDIDRTDLTTQVIKAQTMFQYPPTSPIEGGSFEGVDQPKQLHQSDVPALQTASRKIMENKMAAGIFYRQPINPYLPLPNPPDVDVIRTQSYPGLFQHHNQHHQHQVASGQQISMAEVNSPGHTPHQQCAAAMQTSNFPYFMPQNSISSGKSSVTYSNTGHGAGLANVRANRVVPPAPMPALHQIYSSPHGNSSMSLTGDPMPSNTEDLWKMPTILGLVKDGKQVIPIFKSLIS